MSKKARDRRANQRRLRRFWRNALAPCDPTAGIAAGIKRLEEARADFWRNDVLQDSTRKSGMALYYTRLAG